MPAPPRGSDALIQRTIQDRASITLPLRLQPFSTSSILKGSRIEAYMRLQRCLLALVSALLLAILFAPLSAQDKEQNSATHSVVPAMDKSVDPCVDFYRFACGGWIKNNPIPSDQSIWSRFGELAERNRSELRGILEQAAKAT